MYDLEDDRLSKFGLFWAKFFGKLPPGVKFDPRTRAFEEIGLSGFLNATAERIMQMAQEQSGKKPDVLRVYNDEQFTFSWEIPASGQDVHVLEVVEPDRILKAGVGSYGILTGPRMVWWFDPNRHNLTLFGYDTNISYDLETGKGKHNWLTGKTEVLDIDPIASIRQLEIVVGNGEWTNIDNALQFV